ncbi:MAG: DNA-processing protein DprA [Clostridia bacterium]|nr:DNA-processing protein DprA [Clostridia bacterium]
MENTVAWLLLSAKNRPRKKMSMLAHNFEKEMKTLDMTTNEAVATCSIVEKALKAGYGIITYMDESYPDELRNIAYPPPYLFVRGNVSLLKYPVKIAVVGSREATVYGMNTAADFAHRFAQSNLCVVTGGARGVDTAALRGAMRAKGKVIAVIGTGIDVDYPKENGELFDKIAKSGGLIVSEFPMGMGPLRENFPIRNRVMTAISNSLLVVEAAQKSGALISAAHATEQGKTVFAVPSSIDSPNSVGVNTLLRDGAAFALSPEDVIDEILEREPDKFRKARDYEEPKAEEKVILPKSTPKKEQEQKHLTPFEQAVVNALNSGKETYEEIQEFTLMDTKRLTSLLTIMEIKGIIKLAFRNKYKLNNRTEGK